MTSRDISALLLTVLIALGIGAVTLAPPAGLPSVPGSDKMHHVLAFALLALPAALLSPRMLWAVVPLAAAFGAGIEVVQPFVGRSAELADWVADMAGLAGGASLGLIVRAMRQLQRRRAINC